MLAEADQCVKCGLCAPHCPTYGLLQNEADSPRGRIALIQGLLQGAIENSPGNRQALDRCLMCGNCEQHCPSGVRFTRLLDDFRARSYSRSVSIAGLLRYLLVSRRLLRRLFALWSLSRKTGLAAFLQASWPAHQRVAKILAFLPAQPAGKIKTIPLTSAKKTLSLFSGCLSPDMEPRLINSSMRVLSALGWQVEVPSAQGCCGAMHQHAGDQRQAQQLLQINAAAFSSKQPIVALSTACSAQLQSGFQAMHDTHQAVDILQFLQQQDLTRVDWRADEQTLLIHTPCSLRNALAEPDLIHKVLACLPNSRLLSLPDNERCCGAAGSYMLEQPALADALLQPKLDALALELRQQPVILVTANIGCRLHFVAGLRARGIEVPVCHPLDVLAAALPIEEAISPIPCLPKRGTG
ncbi:MAG: (Fe-S)-binding protein [gamma proteobacterium symbiont of Bathyaustriella thionipta]|nr:(Fe-S)-binding protein [gamma proteobacterium symbiont of Bathyaustriella thionipta]